MMSKIVSFFLDTSNLSEKKKAVFIILLSIINSLVTLFFLILIYLIIDVILGNSKKIDSNLITVISNYLPDIKSLVIFASLLLCFSFILQLIYNFFSNKWIVKYINRLEKNIFKSTLSKDYSFFKKNKSYDYSKLLIDHLARLSLGIFAPVVNIVTHSVIFLIYILFLLQINFLVTLISFLFISILSAGIYFFIKRFLIKLSLLENDSLRNRIKYINNSINLFRELKIYDFKNFLINNFNTNSNIYFKTRYIIYFLSNILKIVFEFLIFFSILILIYLLILNSSNEYYPQLISLLSIFILVLYKLIPSCIMILNSFATISSNIKFFEIVRKDYELINYQVEKYKNLNNSIPNVSSLSLNSISYNYDDAKILQNINLDLNVGNNLILTGPTGSGKSTLLDIISGLIKPSSGSIFINNNTKIDFENNFSLRRKISYSSQNVEIFEDNIYNNISLNFENKTSLDSIEKDLKFQKVIKLSFVKDLLNQKNLSYTEKLFERGQNLSGGEKQRIGIARALYHDRDIMIFDESTSAVDLKLEEKIIQNIIEFSNNKILIICTHNLNLKKFFKNQLNLNDYKIKDI